MKSEAASQEADGMQHPCNVSQWGDLLFHSLAMKGETQGHGYGPLCLWFALGNTHRHREVGGGEPTGPWV